MSLYKYIPSVRIDILQTLLIRFTQPTALNDPFEFLTLIKSIQKPGTTDAMFSDEFDKQFAAVLEKRYGDPDTASLIKRYYPAEVANLKSSTIQQCSAVLEPVIIDFVFNVLGKWIGILSLTEDPANPVMWAHYAENHSGFVLEFSQEHKWFQAKIAETDEFRHLIKVNYVEGAATRYLVELSGYEVFYSKQKVWEYEREWRIIRPLTESTKQDGDCYLFDVPPDCIQSVIVGTKTPARAIEDLRAILSRNPALRHVKISLASINRRTQAIEIVPA